MSQITVRPEQVRHIAQVCRTQSREVAAVERTVNAAIVNSGWKSPAATRFQNDWNTHYVKTLRQLQKALEALGDAATKMAANYDATESAYKGAN